MNDASLRIATIKQKIDIDTHGGVRDLRVAVEGNVMNLSGHARSYYMKQIAQQAAMSSANGMVVENRIEVAK